MSIGKSILDAVERTGNRLPDPVSIFLILIGFIVAVSLIAALVGLSAEHPITGDTIAAQNLLSGTYIRRLLTDLTAIFVNFPPLGLVLVVMIGAGVAERSGLFGAGLRALVRWVPGSLLTAVLVLAGVLGNVAVDAGYVVLIPLGGVLFAAAGRHPVAGIAATFAGVSAGFSANLVFTPLEPILLGIAQTAGQFVDPDLSVDVTGNMWFVMALTPFVVIVATAITEWVVEPRLGTWTPIKGYESDGDGRLSAAERKGLGRAGLTFAGIIIAVLALSLPEGAPLRDAEGSLAGFSGYIVALSMLIFLATGIAYGTAAGTIRSDKEAVKHAGDAMGDMGIYIVLAFVMAVFLALFSWSNLGTLLAIGGASTLQGLGLPAPVLLIAVVLMTAVLNLFVGSASAKWALLAPVVVPMLMLLGISPEASTAAYRVGDSATNIITPLMPYMPLVLVFARRYMPEFGLGSLVATMLPYSLGILIATTAVLFLFVAADLPFGWDGSGASYAGPAVTGQ